MVRHYGIDKMHSKPYDVWGVWEKNLSIGSGVEFDPGAQGARNGKK